MYHTTGFTRAEVTEIAVMINVVELDPEISWPPILGLFRSLVATLTYMRRNRVQAEIGEDFGGGAGGRGRVVSDRIVSNGAAKTTEPVWALVEHGDRLAGLATFVKYFALQRRNRFSKMSAEWKSSS